ncbi:DUF1430 domain-containing protein [Nocardia arthritidis]|uniref:DUF1430 domain-containing protein n=1 Tax=Nocardia arthritidis TaxID=228602 RepID=UPI0012ED8E2A|nr:DUF1430 domain-containing protein [Nocardia arthritidis]
MQLVPRVVIAFGFTLAAIISVAYFELKEQAHTLRGTTEFVIDDFDRSLSKSALYDSLSAVSTRSSVNIYKLSFGESSKDRIFFEFIGSPERKHLLTADGPYITFDPQLSTTFRPASDITTEDIRGRYAVDGTESAKSGAIAELSRLGFNVAIWDQDYGPLLWDNLGRSHLLTIFCVVLLCCALVVGYSALSSTKDYAVKQLHGYGRTRILATGLVEVVATCVGIAAAAATFTAAYLGIYNKFARFDAFLPTLLAAFGVLVLLLVLVKTIAIAIAISLPNSDGRYLKGAKADATLLNFAYVAKLAVLATLLILIVGGIHTITRFADMHLAADRWKATADYLAVSHSTGIPTTDGPEKRRLDAQFRRLFSSFEQQGKAILVAGQHIRSPTGDLVGEKSIDLVVDNNYLRENCLLNLQNKCVRDVSTSDLQMTLLIPEHMKEQENDIVRSYLNLIVFQQRIQGTPVDVGDIKSRIIYFKSGQSLFSYRAATALDGAFVGDPVLLVTEASTRLLSDDFYSAKSSSAEALFTDKDHLSSDLIQSGLDSLIQYYYSIKDKSLQDISDFESASRNQLIGLAITVVSGTVTSSFLAALYCSRSRKRIYVEEIHGYSFFRRHRKMLSGLILGCVTTFAGIAIANSALFAGMYGLVAVGIAGTDFLLTAAFIAVYETRSHASWLKRA